MATQDESANDPLLSQETEVFNAEPLATVGHELRGPLTAIKGYAATLLRHERRIPRQERHEFLFAIVAASDRLEHIVERFLELSQLETGALRIERSPVDVARLAHEALTVAEQRASEHSPGRFTFHLHLKDFSGVPTQNVPIILADHRRLREVLERCSMRSFTCYELGVPGACCRESIPRSTVYGYFAQFRDERVWEQIMTMLRERCRVEAGREATPQCRNH